MRCGGVMRMQNLEKASVGDLEYIQIILRHCPIRILLNMCLLSWDLFMLFVATILITDYYSFLLLQYAINISKNVLKIKIS